MCAYVRRRCTYKYIVWLFRVERRISFDLFCARILIKRFRQKKKNEKYCLRCCFYFSFEFSSFHFFHLSCVSVFVLLCYVGTYLQKNAANCKYKTTSFCEERCRVQQQVILSTFFDYFNCFGCEISLKESHSRSFR